MDGERGGIMAMVSRRTPHWTWAFLTSSHPHHHPHHPALHHTKGRGALWYDNVLGDNVRVFVFTCLAFQSLIWMVSSMRQDSY